MDGSPTPTGRKKLVPALSREAKCPHTYNDDEELCLEIDCGDCQGAQDLANNRCLAGILQILASEAEPETLMLKRHIHRRYRASFLSTLMATASELAALNRALSMKSMPSDSECLTCGASMPKLVGRLRKELLEDPNSFMGDRAEVLEGIRDDLRNIDCRRLHRCVARALVCGRSGEG